MSDELTIDGEQFISSKRASELSGYQQDYIGQLSRGGQILARRVGGLWYVSSGSLTMYMEHAGDYKPVPPANNAGSDPDALLSFDGKGYISAPRASKLTGYSPDYVGQMARAGVIPSRQVGNRWYVERAGVLAHKESKDALLAAVQAESVGIERRDTRLEDPLSHIGYGGAGPFLKYTSDTRELLPNLADDGNGGRESQKEVFQIPIHIINNRRSALYAGASEYESYAADDDGIQRGRLSEKTMYSLVLPAMVMTIVIVISLGFVSLKTSSVYTVNDSMEVGGRRVLTAGAAGALVERLANTLEVFLAPELVYIRGK